MKFIQGDIDSKGQVQVLKPHSTDLLLFTRIYSREDYVGLEAGQRGNVIKFELPIISNCCHSNLSDMETIIEHI